MVLLEPKTTLQQCHSKRSCDSYRVVDRHVAKKRRQHRDSHEGLVCYIRSFFLLLVLHRTPKLRYHCRLANIQVNNRFDTDQDLGLPSDMIVPSKFGGGGLLNLPADMLIKPNFKSIVIRRYFTLVLSWYFLPIKLDGLDHVVWLASAPEVD